MSGYERAYRLLRNYPLTAGCAIGVSMGLGIIILTVGPPHPLTVLIDVLIIAGALTFDTRRKREEEHEEYLRQRAELDMKLHPGGKG